MGLKDFLNSIIIDLNNLRELLSSWIIKFMECRRSDKILGVFRRWVLILLLAVLWAGYAFHVAATNSEKDAHLQTQSLQTYVNSSIYRLVAKAFPMETGCPDCPERALIPKEGIEPNKYLEISLDKENLFQGTPEDWFYRYQILITETAKIQKNTGTTETVDPDTLILFEPEYMGKPFRWLFAPAVLQWATIVASTFWIAFQISALYVNYVYELDDVPAARRFLLQYALGSRYETIRIRDGAVVPKDANKFAARVGGPGHMQVDYDAVAIVETTDGTPTLVDRTSNRQRGFFHLFPFERLRITLPTSDQYMNISLDHKTREGIPLGMRNIEVRYNVCRGDQTPTIENPIVFDPEAIHNLVYNWGHTVGMRLINLVQFQLRVRLLARTFTELFAVISSPDRTLIKQNEESLRELAIQQGGIELSPISVAGVPPPHTRDDVTKLFFDLDKFPVEIQWINVGTWYFPAESLEERHREAWKITHENLTLGKKPVLKGIARKSRREGLCDLIQDVPIKKFKNYREEEMAAPYIAMRLLLDYQNHLLMAQKIIRDQKTPDITPFIPDADLQRLINILGQLIENFDPWMPIYPA